MNHLTGAKTRADDAVIHTTASPISRNISKGTVKVQRTLKSPKKRYISSKYLGLLRIIMYYKTQMKRASTSFFLPCKAMKLKSPLLPESNHQFNERDREKTPLHWRFICL